MRSKLVDKRILVGFPMDLYDEIKKVAANHYQSISAFIRDSVLQRLEEEISDEEKQIVEKGLKESKRRKGVSWRHVKRKSL